MLLAVDIGNSFTKLALFEDEFLLERLAVPTDRAAKYEDLYIRKLARGVRGIVISSVVPELNDVYEAAAKRYFNVKPLFIDSSLDFGLKIKYTPPENLGADRIVAAFAAVQKYGKPCLICDFGTATTIDAVNSDGEYLGGIITPGIKTLADSLHLKTSKLPPVKLKKPPRVIGNSTVASIQSGVFFGYIGLVEGIIQRMIDELKDLPYVVATGGFASLIADDVEYIETVDENLLIEGLRMIYEKARKK